ncbi:hypothetical protein C6A85_52780 [Mycobacterium sp. ITM-2017-0098]|nr:hypothetical protein C6A85_52780 [Mycobacterium sp. ITM-2017-0098]
MLSAVDAVSTAVTPPHTSIPRRDCAGGDELRKHPTLSAASTQKATDLLPLTRLVLQPHGYVTAATYRPRCTKLDVSRLFR